MIISLSCCRAAVGLVPGGFSSLNTDADIRGPANNFMLYKSSQDQTLAEIWAHWEWHCSNEPHADKRNKIQKEQKNNLTACFYLKKNTAEKKSTHLDNCWILILPQTMDMQWHLKCYWESEVLKWDWEMQLGFRGDAHPQSVAGGQEDTPDHQNCH